MPHEYKGITWPVFREPETKKSGRDTAFTLPEPKHTQDTVRFWPPEALPFGYAWYCLEIVLLHSQEANNSYQQAVIALLELPGCQGLVRDFKCFLPDAPVYSSRMMIKGRGGIARLQFLRMFGEIYKRHKDNSDCRVFYGYIQQVVLIGFNREQDKADQRHKVVPEIGKSGYLLSAILIRAIAEACRIRLSDWNKYRADDIHQIMTGKDPTTRPEREVIRLKKREVRAIYDSFKWTRRHDSKLLKDAAKWYKCRVNPGSIEAYLQELAFSTPRGGDQGRISNDIKLLDLATGYPR